LQENQLSDVVTTEYGFHILQVLEKQPPRLQSLEEVKSQIVTTLKNQTVFDRMQDLADQAHAELVKAPQNAQQIAAKLNLSFVNEAHYSPGRPLPELGTDPQIGATLMALKPGEVTPVMQAGSKLAVAVLTAINPPHQAELSEVEPAVRTNYLQLRAVDLVKEKSAKAAELIKQNGDVQAAAKAVGMEAKSTDFFSRSGAAEGIGSAAVLGDLFEKPAGAIFGPMTAANQTVVGKIVERQDIDLSKFAQEREQIVLQLKSRKAADRVSLLRDSVLADLIQRGKVKKHQQVIDRLISQYRG
jgi:peptidyl-prolyl cis-trans isomerase D